MAYWREFVAEYYAPCAKKRWCVSLYDKMELQADGVFSHAAMVCFQAANIFCFSLEDYLYPSNLPSFLQFSFS